MDRFTSSAQGAGRRAAAERDATIADIDWSTPPDGARQTRFPAPSGQLAVVSLGDPRHPRVVLVPGATGSKEDFTLMLPLLAAAGYYVQSYDMAGQYESAAAGPVEGEGYSYELFADDMIAFLEAGGPAHLLGYSFAGTVAQLVALRRPDLVRSLALLATPPGAGNVFRDMRVLGPVASLATARVGASLMIWGIVTNKNRVPPGRLAFVRSRFAYTDRRSVDDIVGLMMHTPDVRGDMSRMRVPKFLAAGTHDLWPRRAYERYAAAIGAEAVFYPTGHSPCETTPHQLCLDLLDLYARAR